MSLMGNGETCIKVKIILANVIIVPLEIMEQATQCDSETGSLTGSSCDSCECEGSHEFFLEDVEKFISKNDRAKKQRCQHCFPNFYVHLAGLLAREKKGYAFSTIFSQRSIKLHKRLEFKVKQCIEMNQHSDFCCGCYDYFLSELHNFFIANKHKDHKFVSKDAVKMWMDTESRLRVCAFDKQPISGKPSVLQMTA